MGFGILFIGYLFALGFTSGTNYILSAVGFAGTVFLFFACRKLAFYSKNFRYAQISSVVLGLSYVFSAVLRICEAYWEVSVLPALSGLSGGAIIASVFIFNYFMYFGISDIASTAGIKKISVSAIRNLILMIVYYALLILARLISPHFPGFAGTVGLCSAVLGLVWLVLSVFLVISAYMNIYIAPDD